MASDLFSGTKVQVALDFTKIEDALRVGEAALKAGADWLEAGTPLITFEGVKAIGALARAFPGIPILADYKSMDGVKKYFVEAANQGAKLATVCGVASDASVRTAVEAGREAGVAIICDLYASPDMARRAGEVEAMGVDSVYVHWGSDQRVEDPARDPQIELPAVLERVRVPVGIGTFSVEDGARGAKQGARILVIGFPLIGQRDTESALREYVDAVRSASAQPG